MDPPRFVYHYRGLVVVLRRCGLPVPWLKNSGSRLSRTAYRAYDILVFLAVLYNLFSYAYTFTSTSLTLADLCLVGICGGCNTCGLLLMIHHVQYGTNIQQLTNNMDAICKKIIYSDLDKREEFLKKYIRYSKIINLLAAYSFVISFATPFAYFLSLPFVEWYTGNYRTHLPIPISSVFNDRLPGVYEVIVIIIVASNSFAGAIKAAYDFLFIALMTMQTAFFRYLNKTQNNITEELFKDNEQRNNKFLTWIKLHQDIVKSNEELIQTFSPVIVIYYLTVIDIVVCGAFIQSKKANDSLLQCFSVSCYIFVTILYYFLVSNTADLLRSEAQKLAFVTYSLPWYQMKRINISMLRLSLTMSNKSIEITAFKAPVFLLNRETYVGFLATAVSAYLTFCKIGEMSEDPQDIVTN